MTDERKPDRLKTVLPLHERAGSAFVAFHDGIGAHIGERLDGERGIEAAHRWKGRAANQEEVRNVPGLAVAVHDRSFRVIAHARAALMMRARGARTEGPTPHLRR